MAYESPHISAVVEAVRRIPCGRVASYGDVGASLDRPLSGLLVGRILAALGEDVPWWRVVGRNGDLLVARRGPNLAVEQAERLRGEGVVLVDARVPMETYRFDLQADSPP